MIEKNLLENPQGVVLACTAHPASELRGMRGVEAKGVLVQRGLASGPLADWRRVGFCHERIFVQGGALTSPEVLQATLDNMPISTRWHLRLHHASLHDGVLTRTWRACCSRCHSMMPKTAATAPIPDVEIKDQLIVRCTGSRAVHELEDLVRVVPDTQASHRRLLADQRISFCPTYQVLPFCPHPTSAIQIAESFSDGWGLLLGVLQTQDVDKPLLSWSPVCSDCRGHGIPAELLTNEGGDLLALSRHIAPPQD